jgi:hypothetical protein
MTGVGSKFGMFLPAVLVEAVVLSVGAELSELECIEKIASKG